MRNQLRIIGGRLRGRKLNFPHIQAIRPTSDRVRETLFNWLQTHIQNATCLDAFCGSGALGFEAISRGAKKVYFYEKEKKIITYLEQTITELAINEKACIKQGCLPREFKLPAHCIDIAFVDPPFDENLVLPFLEILIKSNCLKPKALIYIESNKKYPLELPAQLNLLKSKTAGMVRFQLLGL